MIGLLVGLGIVVGAAVGLMVFAALCWCINESEWGPFVPLAAFIVGGASAAGYGVLGRGRCRSGR